MQQLFKRFTWHGVWKRLVQKTKLLAARTSNSLRPHQWAERLFVMCFSTRGLLCTTLMAAQSTCRRRLRPNRQLHSPGPLFPTPCVASFCLSLLRPLAPWGARSPAPVALPWETCAAASGRYAEAVTGRAVRGFLVEAMAGCRGKAQEERQIRLNRLSTILRCHTSSDVKRSAIANDAVAPAPAAISARTAATLYRASDASTAMLRGT